ncbi:MAG: hypothetical protein K0S28_592 [Paucimonas sp.]|nr:hypothetical protein [Paucimonas sp.]
MLADDVIDAHGNVLLRKGMTLSNAVIASLQRHHVSVLSVVNEEGSTDESAQEEAVHEERLAALFRHPSSPEEATDLLKQCIYHYRLCDVDE